MPKRKIDPATGEPALTHREQRLVDEYISNGGNGARAAASAGYGAARPGQSAYQVLNRPEVQRHICQRIAESRVTADEIIGTLASFMRGRIGNFYDESGEFSIQLAKEREIDHLLKTVTTTTREIKATKSAPAQVVRTCRGQLHSPVQAASVLARIFQLTGPHACFRPRKTDHRSLASDLAADFKVGTWLEDLIQQQMREQDLSRDAVVESLLHTRPEIAKYLRELPGPQNQSAPISLPDAARRPGQQNRTPGVSLPDAAKRVDVILDFMATLATDPEASPDNDPVVESAHQIEAVAEALDTGAITREAFEEACHRIHSRLSEPERHDLHHHFQVKSIILHDITNHPCANETTTSALAETPCPTPDSRLKTPNSAPNLQRANEAAAPIESASTEPALAELPSPTHESRLKIPDSPSNVPTFQRSNVPTPPVPTFQRPNVSTPPVPACERSNVQTRADSPPNIPTCERSNASTPPVPTPPAATGERSNVQTHPSRTRQRDLALHHISKSLSKRECKYPDVIPFHEVLQELVDNSYGAVERVMENIRYDVRHCGATERILVDQAINEFLNPPPPDAPSPPPEPRGIDRYLRQPRHSAQPTSPDSKSQPSNPSNQRPHPSQPPDPANTNGSPSANVKPATCNLQQFPPPRAP